MKKKSLQLADFDKDYLMGRSGVVGVDEAGRGAFAGPVAAAAMFIPAAFFADKVLAERLSLLNDSKQISEETRAAIFEDFEILKKGGKLDFEAAFASVEEIEKINILEATSLAMARAVKILDERNALRLRANSYSATLFGEGDADLSKALVLVDGRAVKSLPYRHVAIVKGDAKSFAIAAASVVAKVTRDRFMEKLALDHPQYGFEKHKGYGTAQHSQSLLVYGASKAHRKSFLKNLRAEPIKDSQIELF